MRVLWLLVIFVALASAYGAGDGDDGGSAARETAAFRIRLKVGDETSSGLVLAVRRPLARIQTPQGERWERIDRLHPPP
jgi:hypothetical protein